MSRFPTYDVRYFDDDAVETHVAWRHLAAFDARLLDSSSSDADSDASSEGASVDDPVAEAVRELAKAVARDPVASVVADLRRQAFVAEPADIAFDPAAAAAVRDILRRHGDFVLDLVIVPLLLIKDPACRAYFLGRVAPGLAGPFVAPEAAAAAVRGALEATCASLDDADWRRVAKTNVGRTKTIHGPAMALKFLGGGGSLVAIAATLNGSGRSFANIARFGARVDAAVASSVFSGINAALARAPSQGLLGPYNRAWLISRATAFLGVRCAANASTTWHEATRVLGYVEDPRIPALDARGAGATPLDVLKIAGCGRADVWYLPMAMCLQRRAAP